MRLTPAMQRFILHWGEMGTRWGVNRSVAQIHALLYLASDPLTAEDIAETLGLARSNVSSSLKELQNWELVQIAHVLGDRRDHFHAEQDIWELLRVIADGRKRREIDPTLNVLRDFAATSNNDQETPPEVQARMLSMLEFLEEVSSWYEQIRLMPRTALMKLMRLGIRMRKIGRN
jgi:DNA-binding transcriptional regulator GbsR (MarR family)